MLTLRNKNNRQVLVDGNLGVNQNVVIGGGLHVEGELSVQHITAPVEIQETEPIVLYGQLLEGLEFSASGPWTHGGTGTIELKGNSNHNLVKMYAHTHPFKNVPLKLMASKDDVRKVGAKTTDHPGPTAAISVEHEKKTGEPGPTS